MTHTHTLKTTLRSHTEPSVFGGVFAMTDTVVLIRLATTTARAHSQPTDCVANCVANHNSCSSLLRAHSRTDITATSQAVSCLASYQLASVRCTTLIEPVCQYAEGDRFSSHHVDWPGHPTLAHHRRWSHLATVPRSSRGGWPRVSTYQR
jgi:hypothetical protein